MRTVKENQHYVPKFYLRHFSFENNLNQIGIFNIEKSFFHPTAKLKTQASKPYFYGEDGEMENILADIEGHQATLLRKMIEDNFIPVKMSKEHAELISLLLLIQLRNPKSSQKTNESFDSLIKKVYEKSDEFRETVEGSTFSINNAIGLSISMLSAGLEFCGDLQYKLIVNKTSVPFITSDNPLVKYNQLMEMNKYPRGATGFASLGLQIFFPINPEKMIIVFDSWAYKVGSRSKKIVETSDARDIDQLNTLQMINCNNIVFFNDRMKKEAIEKLNRNSKHYERPHKVITQEFHNIRRNGKVENGSSVIMNMTTECKIKLNLTFIKITDNAKFFKVDKGIVQIREYCKLLRKPRGDLYEVSL